MRPIEDYFAPYGTLSRLRESNLRSFFTRIKSPFDLPDKERSQAALSPFRNKDGEYECAYCGRPAEEWDHIEEAAQGGGHLLGNLLPACKSCNRRKRSWEEQLLKAAGDALAYRKSRIEKYMEYAGQGHHLFEEDDLKQQLREVENKFFLALADVDKVITEATNRFKKKQQNEEKESK